MVINFAKIEKKWQDKWEKAKVFKTRPLSSNSKDLKGQVGKKYISPKDFSKLVNSIIPQILKTYLNNSWGRPSYVEIILATAFLYFKKSGCKYVVLEVGCGGRDDITNIIRNTKFSIVTNVDYDHIEILGKTLIQIARHKAGTEDQVKHPH